MQHPIQQRGRSRQRQWPGCGTPGPDTPPPAFSTSLGMAQAAAAEGMGETLDRGQGQQLSAGGFVYLPGGMPHSVWTTAEPAEVQVTGTGPFGLNYANPADDPGCAQ